MRKIWFLLLCWIWVPTVTAAPYRLEVPVSSLSGYQWPMYIATERKLFEQFGLDVRLVLVDGAGLVTTIVMGGSASIGSLAPAAAIIAWAKGADIVLVAGGVDRVVNSLMVSPDIKRPQDLRGKSVGIGRFGSLSEWVLVEALKLYDMKVGRDVVALQLGGLAERVSALRSGRTAGAVLNVAEENQVRKLGYHSLVDMKKLPPYPGQGIITTRKFLATNRDIVRNFLKVYVEGIRILKAEKQFSIEVLGRRLKMDDREVLSATYDVFSDAFDLPPLAKPESARQALPDTTARELKIIDNSVLGEVSLR